MHKIIQKIHVNIPFTMLHESYLSRFIREGINPEIGFDASALDLFSLPDYKFIAKQILQRGLSVTMHAPFIDLSPGSPDPEVRALTRRRFNQLIPLIPIFKPKTIVCHTGWENQSYWFLKESWVQYSMEYWSWLAEDVSKEGSSLMLENVYESDPYEFLDLFKGLKHQGIGFCLDTGHQAVFSRTGLLVWLETLGEYIAQLHLHDNNGIRDDHLALGKGEIDFTRLFKYLKEKKLRPPIITLEPHGEDDFLPSLEYLENIWPW